MERKSKLGIVWKNIEHHQTRISYESSANLYNFAPDCHSSVDVLFAERGLSLSTHNRCRCVNWPQASTASVTQTCDFTCVCLNLSHISVHSNV